jgi:hypothetical protein
MFGKYKYTNTKYTWDGACFQIIGDSEHGNGEASPQRVLLAYAAAAGSAGAAIGERAAFKALVDRVRAGLEFLVSGVCVSCFVFVCVCVCVRGAGTFSSPRGLRMRGGQVPNFRYVTMQLSTAMMFLVCGLAIAAAGLQRRRRRAGEGETPPPPPPPLPSAVPWSRVTLAAVLEAAQVCPVGAF